MNSRVAFHIVWVVSTLIVVAYGLGMVEYGFAIWEGRLPRALDAMALAMSPDMVWGRNGYPDWVTPLYALFERNRLAMTAHILAGSAVLVLGFTQFVPPLRRRWPRVHRTVGFVVLLSMVITLVGATVRLAAEPAELTYSGPGFDVVLWYLSVIGILTLSQAVIALVRRDYRQHMVWMALAWAAFLTAPSLRVNTSALFWLYGGLHEHANFAAGAMALVETGLLMLLWLRFVGEPDLPARGPQATRWPRWMLSAMAVCAAAMAMHEGVLAPLGADAFAGLRGELGTLPLTAIPWGLATAGAALGGVRALEGSLEGRTPAGWWHITVALAGLGALGVAATTPAGGLLTQPVNAVFLTLGITSIALLLGSLRGGVNTLERRPWSVTLAFFTWAPSVLVLGAALGLMFGLTADELYVVGLVLGPTTMSLLGICTANAAVVRLGLTRSERPGRLVSSPGR